MRRLVAAAIILAAPLTAAAESPQLSSSVEVGAPRHIEGVPERILDTWGERGPLVRLSGGSRGVAEQPRLLGGIKIGGNRESNRRRNGFDSGRFDTFGFRQNHFDY